MLLLNASTFVRVTTLFEVGGSPSLACYAVAANLTSSVAFAPAFATITTSTTTNLVQGASSTSTKLMSAIIRNTGNRSVSVTIEHYDGTNTRQVICVCLCPGTASLAGDSLQYEERRGWRVIDGVGGFKSVTDRTFPTPAIGALAIATLDRDIVSTSTADAFIECPTLGMYVTAAGMYWFRFHLIIQSVAGTGARCALTGGISGSGAAYVAYFAMQMTSGPTTQWYGDGQSTLENPSSQPATSPGTGNILHGIVEGFITPKRGVALTVGFAPEDANAITAKAGSNLQYMRVL